VDRCYVARVPRWVAGRQFDLLRRAPEFRLLFLAALGSALGSRLAVTALLVDVWDRTDSGKWVAALLIADFLPTIVIGLLLGSLIDRLSRRRMMITSDLVRCAAFCALPFATGPEMVVALAGVVGFANGFFRPALYAALPNFVDDDDLADANGVFQGGENAAWMLGPLLAGGLLTISGPDVPYWVNAATFLLSAVLIARIPSRFFQAAAVESRGHWRDLAEGFVTVLRARPLLTVLIAWSIVLLGAASVDVAEVTLAKETFNGGNFGLGVLMSAAGLGLIVGSFGAGAFTRRLGVPSAYALSIALVGVAAGLAAVSPNVWVASAFAVLFGLGNGIAIVANSLLVQRGAPDSVRGRAFTVIMSANYAAYLVGMVIAGFLTDAWGARATWGVAAALTLLGAAVGYVIVRGAPEQLREPAETLPTSVGPEVGVMHE
jgi:MFS family permease